MTPLDIDNIADLRSKAEAGSIVAQSVLGIVLLDGIGCDADYAEAFHWLSAASERGASRAIWHLGRMYEAGLHVAVDPHRARSLYERAASRGEFFACVYLARLLASGQLGTISDEEPLRWYRAVLAQAPDVQDCPELEEARSYVASHGRAGGQ